MPEAKSNGEKPNPYEKMGLIIKKGVNGACDLVRTIHGKEWLRWAALGWTISKELELNDKGKSLEAQKKKDARNAKILEEMEKQKKAHDEQVIQQRAREEVKAEKEKEAKVEAEVRKAAEEAKAEKANAKK